ncbi:PSD1 and planctomycete cytochrome C domain-containing protein [Rhodopirellula sp. MGV]|uniref:PSD1 and planctomycete cytochrome C domain-containing protein n=1 Tax=Rhodopirellula sp. MGV TaxID=2023130 RepID=UPI000B976FDC|nr:PSD1 and planctomycete cytochrome C domain-containing protein [Rhodopirellula sp. MGV]OYP31641.1 hypothetical protein CGZ80_20975 [Rhodopirellula sp. MGV]PNY33491.1 DUF1553 domain-containing protein [Rhodopirellula baltica]
MSHDRWVAFVIAFTTTFSFASADDDFAETVAPILQQRCLDCHNEQLGKGDFSLTTAEDLIASGYLDLDNADDSYLLELVTPVDGHASMPKDAQPLSDQEIDSLRKWIRQGAKWPAQVKLHQSFVRDKDWWSLKPITSPPVPESDAANPVDAFINQALSSRGMAAVEKAPPQVLLRRVTYDLTGLPPTPAESLAFLADWQIDQQAAWESLVGRLLQSKRFGEKWGQHWLDVSRYAETHGFDKDKPRSNAWPYRDYVIASLNDDKPYDRFVQEQVAGDVLFPNDPDGVLGLGFLAAGPWDFIGHWEVGEGKLDGRIAKHLDRDEMISAVFNVFQSTTVQCAQCHHHKFDPIRMQDYYRLHAVFSAVDRADRVFAGRSAAQQRADELDRQITALQSRRDDHQRQQQDLTAKQTAPIDLKITELTQRFRTEQPQQPQFGYHSQIASNPNEEKWVQIDLGSPRLIDEIKLFPAFDEFAGIGAGFGFPVRYRVDVALDERLIDGHRVLFDASGSDQPNPGCVTINIASDRQPIQFIRVTATQLAERSDDFIFAIAEIEAIADRHNVALNCNVTAKDTIEAPVRWGKQNVVDGIYFKELTDDDAMERLQQLRRERQQLVRRSRSEQVESELRNLRDQIDAAIAARNQIPPGKFVYAAATSFDAGGQFLPTNGQPRPIHLLLRGDLRSPSELMRPGAPPLWDTAPETFVDEDHWDEGIARAELARYLTSTDNPLAWRSIANRLWGWTFGQPLVGTANDFGRGGTTPSHPELLDYLAARLRDDPDHSLHSIVNLLVTSEAYQRSSRVDPEMAALDADNALLWRANRRRLTAEEYRDSLYAIAGTLDDSMGGPSFQDFVIEKPEHSPHYQYDQHDFESTASHRRSIYRFVVRSQPQPMLTTLDCADPSISTPRRDESTTALQALTYWNDRLVEYAARHFADRIRTHNVNPNQQVDFACQLSLGRLPNELESKVLHEHLRDHGPANLARILFNLNAFVYLD